MTKERALLNFSAELGTKFLIILFMNDLHINYYSLQALNPRTEEPVDLEVMASYEGRQRIFKFVMYIRDNEPMIDCVILDPSKASTVIYHGNGTAKSLEKTRRTFNITFASGEADDLGRQFAEWYIKELKGEEEND